MKNIKNLNTIFLLVAVVFSFRSTAQLPNPAIVGYWESWNGDRYVDLKDIDDRYNVIQLSFANAKNNADSTDYDMEYNPPWNYTEADFKSEIQFLQDQGKKVLISLGGQNEYHQLDDVNERNVFISSTNAMIDKWGVDGIDIDLEGNSLKDFKDFTIKTPGNAKIDNFIEALKQIMTNHYATHKKKMLLTMAPETFYVHGAFKNSNSNQGAYLPIIEALRDSIDMLNVQLYNSGAMFGLDNRAYEQGTADWVVAMTEMTIRGFKAHGDIGTYTGLPASKVGVALPGCHSYDAVPHDEISKAIKYLMGEGDQAGDYELIEKDGYPGLRGMMTWSINSDKTCSPSYGFVNTWSKIFTNTPYIEISNVSDILEGEENGGEIEVNLYNNEFSNSLNPSNWTIENLPESVTVGEIVRVDNSTARIVLSGNSTTPYFTSITTISVTISKEELKTSEISVSADNGVTLKKGLYIIPGRVEAEGFISIKNKRIKKDFKGTDGHFNQFWENEWAEYKIKVDKPNTYTIVFKVATAINEGFSIKMTINDDFEFDYKIISETTYANWEYYTYEIDLPKGENVLRLDMSAGWCALDFFDIYNANSIDDPRIEVLTLYPNPMSNTVSIDAPNSGALEIAGMNGQKVLEQKVSKGKSALDISHVSPGIYMVKFTDNTGKILRNRIVKK